MKYTAIITIWSIKWIKKKSAVFIFISFFDSIVCKSSLGMTSRNSMIINKFLAITANLQPKKITCIETC